MQLARSPGALRPITPKETHRRVAMETVGLGAALRAARRLEAVARACQFAIAEGNARSIRAALGQAFDALEVVEDALAVEFPPRDPGRPA